MPTVLPASSVPTNFGFSHLPAAIEAAARGTQRSCASSTAKVCSTAETTLPVGELRTRTPRSEAAGTSTLSTPTPARPTTVRRGAAARSAASTFVALRTRSASASASASRSVSRGAPARSTTSWPAWRSMSSPAALSFSATTTLLMVYCPSGDSSTWESASRQRPPHPGPLRPPRGGEGISRARDDTKATLPLTTPRPAPRAAPPATPGPRRPCGRCGTSSPSTRRSRRRS